MKCQPIISTQLLLAALLLACAPQAEVKPNGKADRNPAPQRSHHPTFFLDDDRLADADRDVGNWLLNGRTYADQRFSPLDQIDEDNVEQLGLRWSLDTQTDRGLEATPIVVDGVLYASGSWSVVFAVDARTGREIWRWDPQVPRSYGQRACCDDGFARLGGISSRSRYFPGSGFCRRGSCVPPTRIRLAATSTSLSRCFEASRIRPSSAVWNARCGWGRRACAPKRSRCFRTWATDRPGASSF